MLAKSDSSCSALHREAPLTGTAPVQTTWLVVECPKPWAPKVEKSTGFPAALREYHERLKGQVRYGLFARVPVGEPRVVVYRFDGHRALEVSGPVDTACDWLAGALQGPPQGGAVEPCLYVCTHGSRDSCCGRLGVPLLLAARALDKRTVHECSHLGGHRFAPTLLLMPEWRVYGRVPGERALDLLEGRLSADYLRGSAYLEPLLQVAQPAVEQALGEPVEDLRLEESSGMTHVLKAHTRAGREHRFQAVIESQRKISPLSCADLEGGEHTEYRLVGLLEV